MSQPQLVQILLILSLVSLFGMLVSFVLVRREKKVLRELERKATDIVTSITGAISQILHLTAPEETPKEKPVVLPKEETQLTPDDHVEVRRLLRRAEKLFDEGDLVEVEKVLIEALAINPKEEDVLLALAYLYRQQEKYSKAESLYVELIEAEVETPSVYGGLGRVLEKQGRFELAVKALKEALRRDPHNPKRHASLGNVYVEMGAMKDAVEAFEQALRYDTKNIVYLFALAETYMAMDALMMASKYLDAILYNEPYNERAKELLLQVHSGGMMDTSSSS